MLLASRRPEGPGEEGTRTHAYRAPRARRSAAAAEHCGRRVLTTEWVGGLSWNEFRDIATPVLADEDVHSVLELRDRSSHRAKVRDVAAQAIEAGQEPREVWRALCEEFDVPPARR